MGVRPKPEGLNADLTVSEEMAGNPVVMQILQADMQRQGFFIARGENGQKKLVSNEGELVAGTKNGVRYTLYFGEVARGTAKDLETGLHEKSGVEGDAAKADVEEEEQDATADGSDDLTKPEGKPGDVESGPRRYLLVKVDFDEALMGEKPVEPVAPEMPAILNEGVIPSETPGDAKAETPANDAQPSHGVAPENAAPADAAPPLDDAATPKEEAPLEPGEKPADESASTEAGQDEASEPAPVESACDEPAAADVVDPEPTSSEPADAAANDSQATTIEPATIEPATSDETPEIIPANEVPSESAKVETDTPAVDGAEKPVLPATTPQEPAPLLIRRQKLRSSTCRHSANMKRRNQDSQMR